MRKSTPIIVSLWLLSACQGKIFEGSTHEKNSAEKQSADSEAAPANKSTTDQTAGATQNAAITGNDAASPPAQISGAFLVCSPTFNDKHEAMCTTESKATNKPVDVDPQVAFLIMGADQSKVATTFKKTANVGEILVAVPTNLTADFGVTLSNTDGLVADWVSASISKYNIVQDGGFESFDVPEGQGGTFFAETESKFWRGKRAPGSACESPVVILEVQNKGGTTPNESYEGKNRMELDSTCEVGADAGGANVIIYQDLTLDPTHTYELKYRVSRREGASAGYLTVDWGGLRINTMSVGSSSWQTVSSLLKPTVTSTRIAFGEGGPEDGVGALLDAVEVLDLGVIK